MLFDKYNAKNIMRLIFNSIILLAFALNAKAQFNPEAIEIIKPVSEAIINNSGIEADFTFKLVDRQTEAETLDSGKMVLKGDKYILSIMGTRTIFNGTTQWVHLLDEEEVTISTPLPDDAMELTPYTAFNMYKKGFRFKIIEQANNIATIDMFPENKDLPYFKLRIVLDTKDKKYKQIVASGRDGSDIYIDIKAYKTNLNLRDEMFVFNESKYLDVDVIDMR